VKSYGLFIYFFSDKIFIIEIDFENEMPTTLLGFDDNSLQGVALCLVMHENRNSWLYMYMFRLKVMAF